MMSLRDPLESVGCVVCGFSVHANLQGVGMCDKPFRAGDGNAARTKRLQPLLRHVNDARYLEEFKDVDR